MLIETNASNKYWCGILIEKHWYKEEIYGYASGSFKNEEINYLSSHKEILAFKKTVNHFKLYLKLVKFIVRTDLKIIPGIFKNENIKAKNSSRILKWFLWLRNFDFEIVYKLGYLNCVVDMLTRKGLQEKPNLNMFISGASRSSNKKCKFRIFKDPLTKEERDNF